MPSDSRGKAGGEPMFIDERVKHVGLTKLRHLNADTLRELDDNLLVLQDGDEPVAERGVGAHEPIWREPTML